ncbi:hypothetical protein [Streptomyces sp. NPDC048392]|uniref:hypothetical protein n=1 Tax=Streptomyces sp. NPDC048392 TaxID=3365543 RepID=UPI003719F08F
MDLTRRRQLRDQGTHLLWRIERREGRRAQGVLPDDSCLARLIEYRVNGQAGTSA